MSILHKLTSLSYFGDILYLNEYEEANLFLIKQAFKISSYYTFFISITSLFFVIFISIMNIINLFLENSTISFLLATSPFIFIKIIIFSLIIFSFVRSLIISFLAIIVKSKQFSYPLKKYLTIIRFNFLITLFIYTCIAAILVIYPYSVKYATLFYIGLFLLTPIKAAFFIYYRTFILKQTPMQIYNPIIFKTLNLFAYGDYYFLLSNNELCKTYITKLFYLHSTLLTIIVLLGYIFTFGFTLPFIQLMLTNLFYLMIILSYILANIYLFITSILSIYFLKKIKVTNQKVKSYLQSISLNSKITLFFQITIILISGLSFKISINNKIITLFISLACLIKILFYLYSRKKLKNLM